MSVLARQQARQSGNLPPLEFPPAAECPLIPKKPFALPNLALDAARATADARRSRHASGSAQTDDWVCNVATAWPLARAVASNRVTVAGVAAVCQAGPATLVLGARSTTGHSAR
jgi:hypothetical protein